MNTNDDFARLGILPNKRMSGALELEMRCWVQLLRLFRSELTTRTRLPLGTRFKAWRAGFSSRSWLMYQLEKNDPELYLPDLPMAARFYKVNGFFNSPMNNKLLLSRLLTAHGVPHPAVVSMVVEGRLIEDGRPFDSDIGRTLTRTLAHCPRQVFRPTWSGSGQGVFFLNRESEELLLNGKPVSLQQACALLSGLDRYVATEHVRQADYAREIFAHSTNTIRVLTVWDAESGDTLAVAVTHRFGTSRSAPIDNWHQGRGGVCAAVDPERGTLGKALRLSADDELVWESMHPETGAAIEGVVIPGFDKCLEGVKQAAGFFPYCPCVGWDVVITNDGWRIIEANPIPGLTIIQAHTPMLRDPHVRRVFERWGLAPRRHDRNRRPPGPADSTPAS